MLRLRLRMRMRMRMRWRIGVVEKQRMEKWSDGKP
jgi:hypothetical protein